MKIVICPDCGSEVEWIKLYESKRYDGFLKCSGCGREGRLYTSKQNAVKAWLKGKGV